MTHDALDIRLELEQNPPLSRYPQRAPQPVINAVALVSGGLDSLATAADVVANYEHACLLAYRPSPHVIRAQNAVSAALTEKVHRPVKTTDFRVEVKHVNTDAPLPEYDLSQRGRTLFFCGVAAAIAASRDVESVTLGENGIMAINCPLTIGRAGGFSTHTARPDVLSLMGRLFSLVLNKQVAIINPLLHKTKTEVVREITRAGLGTTIPHTHSCWIARQPKHCGVCVPCLVRRFATEAAGAPDVTYQYDIFNAPTLPEDSKSNNIVDYLPFAITLADLSDDELLLEYSELNVEGGVAARRPILDLHRRWARDVLTVARSHPTLAALL
jgi:7-cyano-7-deazaguanine synthase in queuosine biosynthesis